MISKALLACLAVLTALFSTVPAQTLRIVAYNVQDKPTTSSQRADLRAIIDAIGEHPSNGVPRAIDILAFQEGPQQLINYSNLEADFETVFGGDYDVVFATADPFGCRTGFVFRADTVTLINSQSIDNMGFTHRPCVATFCPVGGEEEDEFSMISLHLKAGTTSSDIQKRFLESFAVGNIVDTLPDGQPVIFLGDFNMKDSDERAWPELMLAGARETINAPVGLRIAKWNDNFAFYPFHTQDCSGATGGLDDRFDAIFVNDAFVNNVGIELVQGSLTTLGNNGTHIMNGSVATGDGAANVQGSLIRISDHLPVFADFDWGVFRSEPVNSLSQPATTTFTVRPSGPVTGGTGVNSLDVEGTSNGSFASFGIIDINLAGVLSADEIASRVEDVRLTLVQDNESFTDDGPISVYVASSAAAAVNINSSIRYQSGRNGIDCVPSVLSDDAVRSCVFPSVHHTVNNVNLPDGSSDDVMLYGDAIRTALTVAMSEGGSVRLIVVPEHPQTAATFAGFNNASFSGPTISALFDTSSLHPIGGGRGPRLKARFPVIR